MRWPFCGAGTPSGGPGKPMPAQKAALEGLAPVELPGPWPLGMALGMHSEPGDAGPVLTSAGVLLDRFKYGGERRLARLIAQAMAEMLRGRPRFAEVQLVLHVPGSRRRGGVEPPCDLARAIARELRVLCLPRFLAATRHLLSQKDITSWEAKKHNVQGAFRVRRAEFVSGRKVLLVDDVFDSGATLEEVWRALMDAGAREVVVATVTKTHYRRDA